jgi:hypothetical protein
VPFPKVVDIDRPQDEYAVILTLVKMEINRAVSDDKFVLEQPEGTQLQVLGQPSTTPPPPPPPPPKERRRKVTAKLVLENLKHKPMRSLLSMFLIAVPVTLILCLVGLSRGMLADSARRARGIGADIIVRPPQDFRADSQRRAHPRKAGRCHSAKAPRGAGHGGDRASHVQRHLRQRYRSGCASTR